MMSFTYFRKANLPHSTEHTFALKKLIEDPAWGKILTKKQFSIKVLPNVSYRQLNYWTEVNLLNDHRKEKTRWRKFSFLDLTWLKIVSTLKNFGASNESISHTKECALNLRGFFTGVTRELFEGTCKIREFKCPASEKDRLLQKSYDILGSLLPKGWDPTEMHLPLFELYIIMAAQGTPAYLFVYENGFCDFGTKLEIEDAEKEGIKIPPHIRIDLREMVPATMTTAMETQPVLSDTTLSKAESALIEAVRSGHYEKIGVLLIKDKIRLLETTFSIPVDIKPAALLRQSGYQDINITRKEGHTAKILQTTKHRFDP